MTGNNFPRFLLLFEILNFLINHDWFFWLIGKFNAKGWIKSVFLSYPGNDQYEREYAYKFRIGSWKIRLTAFLPQNGKLVIMFTVFVRENEFLNKNNKEKLEEVVRHVEKIRQLLRADQKTFAGILPGLLLKRKLVDETPEADITAAIVTEAVELVKKKMGIEGEITIVILGGRGFIGKRVAGNLKSIQKFGVHIVDLDDRDKWPEGKTRKIIINLARHDTIPLYYDALREGDIVLNEAYPAPSSEIISEIKSLNCHCFHVVGVEGAAFPRFTQGYEEGNPCCSAWSGKKAIIKKLT